MPENINAIEGRISRLEERSETEAVRCPHREAISRAANNRERIEQAERDIVMVREVLTTLRIDVAKTGLVGGLAGGGGLGIVGAVLFAIGKSGGWW